MQSASQCWGFTLPRFPFRGEIVCGKRLTKASGQLAPGQVDDFPPVIAAPALESHEPLFSRGSMPFDFKSA